MQRKGQIVLVAHCVLNQNSVIKGWARARGAFLDVVQLLLKEGIGILQLPCPEKTFGGLGRPPKTSEEYDTSDYRLHSRELLKGLMEELLDYQANGVELIGVIGIEDSPSCCVEKGIFYHELLTLLRSNGFLVEEGGGATVICIPPDHSEDLPRNDFIDQLAVWLKR